MSIVLRRCAAVIALVALAVVLVVTNSTRLRKPLRGPRVIAVASRRSGPSLSPSPTKTATPSTPGFQLGWKALSLLAVAVAVAVLALLGWSIWIRLRDRRRLAGRLALAATIAPDPADPVGERVSAALADAALSLRRGRSDEAIVACWLRLEQLAEQAGIGRSASRTSGELARRVLETTGADSGRLTRLEALYREARFSDHRMSEDDRESAAQDLTELSRDVRRRTAPNRGPTPPGPTPPGPTPLAAMPPGVTPPGSTTGGPSSPARR